MPDAWSDRRDALPQGCVLRDYTIEEVLGHGGFGIVYKARHNELDHVVAIKEYLPSELAVREGATIRAKSAECETHFADGLRRFREEAKALIEFQQHPSIVDCREFFRANGTAYLVMEYVEGLPLSESLRQRESAGMPFTETDLLAVAIPLAQGLVHIHRAGVIHRDIKPANILVRRSDQQPVLIDFGAAKQAVAEHSRSLAPYTEGYAALEQVADGQLGPWTDLYGFGAVLWRMVAGGNPPWNPPNPVKVESRANARVREAGDPLPTAKELGAGRFAEQVLEMIDGCLQLRDTERIRESDRVVEVLQGSGGDRQQRETAEPRAGGSSDVDQQPSGRAEAQPDRSSTGRWWKIVGVATVVVVALALAAVALIPKDENLGTTETWNFSVEPEPATATVALLNGPEAYRPGMPLVPGRYEVEVSAPGYVARREWVTHVESETLLQVQLERLPDVVPELAQTPSDADVEASDSTAAAQERVASSASDPKQPRVETQAEQVQTPSAADDDLEAANATTVDDEQVSRREGSSASKTVVTDSAVASDSEKIDTEEVSPSNCEAGVGGWENCFQIAESYRKGNGVPRDVARAAQFYEHACDGGHTEACSILGLIRDGGEVYKEACDGGDAEGCWHLGNIYEEGDGESRDYGRAQESYRLACAGGYAQGCRDLARYFIDKDPSQVVDLYKQACDGGDATACNALGVMYGDGNGVVENSSRAADLYKQACDGGEPWGCRNLGLRYEMGEGVPLDRVRAAEFYGRACEGGLAPACNSLGRLYFNGYGVSRNLGRAAELFRRGCDGGEAWGCYNLGDSFENGEGVPQDLSRATDFYHKACSGDNMSGCTRLARNYYFGLGIRQDLSAAESLLEKACGSDHEDACEKLGSLDSLTMRTWE